MSIQGWLNRELRVFNVNKRINDLSGLGENRGISVQSGLWEI